MNALALHATTGQPGAVDAHRADRTGRPSMWMVLLAIAVTLAGLMSGCSSTTHGSFLSVDLIDDTHIVVNTLPCPDGGISTRVTESAADVRILVSYDANDDAKCNGLTTVTLESPLGTRLVIDDHTGDVLPVNSDSRCTPKLNLERCDGQTSGTFPTEQT